MSELELYKKNRIRGLQSVYSRKIADLQNELRHAIRTIQTKRLFSKLKSQQINKVTTTYISYANTLTRQLNNDILNVKNYVPEPYIPSTKKNALLIGCNYLNTPHELHGCVNDVTNVSKRLTSQGFSITTLTDYTEKKPTKENILNAFKDLLTSSSKGDLLFFMYSGHGSNVVDKNGDEPDRMDELLITCDLKGIVDDDLKLLLNQHLPNGVTLFAMFDSCFSGTVLDLKYQFLDSLNYDSYTEHSKNIETKGNVYMISGCTDKQTSSDAYINNQSQGAMTWALLECVNHPTWRDLVKNMRTVLKKSGFNQIPQFSSSNFVDIDSAVFI
jgi:hypothetical protein